MKSLSVVLGSQFWVGQSRSQSRLKPEETIIGELRRHLAGDAYEQHAGVQIISLSVLVNGNERVK